VRQIAPGVGLVLLTAVFVGCSRSNEEVVALRTELKATQEEVVALRAELKATRDESAELRTQITRNTNDGTLPSRDSKITVYLALPGAQRLTDTPAELEGLPLRATNFRSNVCDLYDYKGRLFAGIVSPDAYTRVAPAEAKVAAACEFYKRKMRYTDYQELK